MSVGIYDQISEYSLAVFSNLQYGFRKAEAANGSVL